MRPALVGDNPIERLALMSGLVPTELMLQSLAMGYARTVGAAVRLGVFEALADGPRDASEVATATGCDPVGMATLLSALNGVGLISRRGGRFALRRPARRWFLRATPGNLRDASLFLADLWDRWSGLETAVRTGKTPDFHAAGQDPGHWERYLRGLACFADMARGEVARKAALPPHTGRVLDIGGGHGVYAIGMCERNTALQVDVLDLPDAARVGRTLVAERGFSERVRYVEGDHRTAPLGQGWDAVMIFNVLHNEPAEAGRDLVRRAAQALRPGGVLLVLDSEHREPTGDVSAVAGLNEVFFFLINGTAAWPEATMRGWMEQAGLPPVGTRRLLRAPAVLLRGVKAS